jgi:membrane-bound serine protease (ClpP class)
MMSLAVAFTSLILVGLVIVIVWVAAVSRHKKASVGPLDLVYAVGLVETPLQPEGSVLVQGELWRATSRTGKTIQRSRSVRVVGASGHLLEVEPTDVALPR